MRIAIVQLQGIGNAILTTPLIHAVHSLGNEMTVIANYSRGSEPAFANWPVITHLCDRLPPITQKFDLVIWCHLIWGDVETALRLKGTPAIYPEPCQRPKDGAWQERFRKHEVEYLVDMARSIGFQGPIPPQRVFHHPQPVQTKRIAIGIGYLKNGLWDQKHWGNENYRQLCHRLLDNGYQPVLVGDAKDWEQDGRIIATDGGVESLCGRPLQEVVDQMSGCGAFIGNDTGLMHVAAALGRPVVAIFCASNPVKNRPWCDQSAVIDGNICDAGDPMRAMARLTAQGIDE